MLERDDAIPGCLRSRHPYANCLLNLIGRDRRIERLVSLRVLRHDWAILLKSPASIRSLGRSFDLEYRELRTLGVPTS